MSGIKGLLLFMLLGATYFGAEAEEDARLPYFGECRRGWFMTFSLDNNVNCIELLPLMSLHCPQLACTLYRLLLWGRLLLLPWLFNLLWWLLWSPWSRGIQILLWATAFLCSLVSAPVTYVKPLGAVLSSVSILLLSACISLQPIGWVQARTSGWMEIKN